MSGVLRGLAQPDVDRDLVSSHCHDVLVPKFLVRAEPPFSDNAALIEPPFLLILQLLTFETWIGLSRSAIPP
jgi:hypothetical protein